jgi:hypothetical protein
LKGIQDSDTEEQKERRASSFSLSLKKEQKKKEKKNAPPTPSTRGLKKKLINQSPLPHLETGDKVPPPSPCCSEPQVFPQLRSDRLKDQGVKALTRRPAPSVPI